MVVGGGGAGHRDGMQAEPSSGLSGIPALALASPGRRGQWQKPGCSLNRALSHRKHEELCLSSAQVLTRARHFSQPASPLRS